GHRARSRCSRAPGAQTRAATHPRPPACGRPAGPARPVAPVQSAAPLPAISPCAASYVKRLAGHSARRSESEPASAVKRQIGGEKKSPAERGFKVLRGNGGVLFRDFWGLANWRPPHPGDKYTAEFSFVK